ncbi:hypothetical protein [Citrobacter portucalensis]|uniref:hypothetical protein n=1 Tax=Citrobacter portucalensis TaxID=1639133 RepID=UPI00226BBBAB|nr:hypothetical protein [Citrobacter portucalensis]MCX8984240.1 hypothetical protein [Citrobacter portucalensis]
MRSTLKWILTLALVLLFITLIGGLSIRYAGLVLYWQDSLKQARTGLFIWRLCLYGMTAGLWLSLERRRGKQIQAYLPALRRMAGLSAILLVLCELSNALHGEALQ